MSTTVVKSRVDRFAGLSDRSIPVQNTRIECSNLLNLDFSERVMKMRPGFSRLNSTAFKDCCASLDGYNDFGRIKGMSFGATDRFGFACEVQIRAYTTSTNATVISRGYGTGANRFVHCYYDFSSTGSWVVKAYDATAGALKTWTVTDGNAARSQIMANRHLEFYNSSGTTWTFRVRDGNGTEIGSDSLSTIGTFITTSLDFWVGCDTTAGTDAPAWADSSFGPFNISDLRFYKNAAGGGATTIFNAVSASISGRQLRFYMEEYTTSSDNGLYAYFPLNEGTGDYSADACTSSTKRIQWGANHPDWVTNSSYMFGTSALQFGGEDGEIIWNLGSGTTTTIFSNAATGQRKWLVTFVFVPLMATGESTVRDQTLLWWGASTTIPAPLGIRVESDNIKTYYRDGGATVSHSVSLALSSYVGQRVRVSVTYQDSAGTPTVRTVVLPETALTGSTNSSNTATTNPSSLSDNVCVGRLCTSYTYPYTFNDRSAFGVIDDIVIFKDYSTGYTPYLYISNSLIFREVNVSDVIAGIAPIQSNVQIVAGLRLNDGAGNNLATIGNSTSQTAYLFPAPDDGMWWDNGFVTCADPPEIDLVEEYARVGPKGTLLQDILVLCGGGLWAYNQSTGTTRGLGFIPKEGKASYTQYGSVAYIGRGNGHRPFRCDGSTCYQMGIRPPIIAPSVAAAAGAGFPAGTYYVYYTFRNPVTGVESNPSPGSTVTTAAGNLAINVTVLQRSSERQVGERRIYVTAINAAAGSTAYYSATVTDNRTTSGAPIVQLTSTTATVTMSYLANKEPPVGNLVRVYKDRMWVAGIPQYPTRAYYSTIGSPESFSSTGYMDVDLDTGDPVVGLTTMYDRLVAYLRDGRVFITPTGDTTTPFLLNFASRNTGAVGHNAILDSDHPPSINDKQGKHIFLADSQVAMWDGSGTENLSSPPGFDRPAIEYTYRETLSRAYAHKWTIAGYTLRRQVWCAVSSSNATRCDTVLVYDVGQGVWTKYTLDCEFMREVDDTNGVPSLLFGSHGFLCKVGGNDFDGLSSVAIPFDGTGSSGYSVTFSSTVMTAGAYSGLFLHVYDYSASRYYRNRIVYNSTTTVYLDTTGTSLPTLAAEDTCLIGGIGLLADFCVDFGSSLTNKRLRWLTIGAHMPSSGSVSGCVKATGSGRAPSLSNASTFTAAVEPTSSPKGEVVVGGLGNVFTLRLFAGPNDDNVGAPVAAAPYFVTEFEVEADLMEFR